MSNAEIDAAAGEAHRFLARVEEYRRAIDALRERSDYSPHYPYSMPERAAMRRASLDLTQALARMRRRSR